MNITFIIGNGFDLNLGLKTKYKHFLNEYVQEDKEDTDTIRFFKAKLRNDIDLWGDAEKAFGEYTGLFKKEGKNAEDFCDCHEHFCIKLAEYLKKEQAKVDLDKIKPVIKKSFFKALSGYTSGFRRDEKLAIERIISTIPGAFNYRFISFNYTETFDVFLEIIREVTGVAGTRVVANTRHTNTLGNVIHVHGYTYKDMVLGVNDESQISDITLFDGYDEEYINEIIKIKTNEMNQEDMDNQAYEILKSSDLIYIYGMSIGKTDAQWWFRICDLMKKKKTMQLIIRRNGVPDNELLQRKRVTFVKKKRREFLRYGEMSEEEYADVFQRIHIDGSNIFEAFKDIAKSKIDNPKEL